MEVCTFLWSAPATASAVERRHPLRGDPCLPWPGASGSPRSLLRSSLLALALRHCRLHRSSAHAMSPRASVKLNWTIDFACLGMRRICVNAGANASTAPNIGATTCI